MRKKDPPVPPILTAVEELTDLADLEAEKASKQEAKGKKVKDEKAKVDKAARSWIYDQDEEHSYEHIKNTYKTVHAYLKFVHKQDPQALKERSMQKGLRSIIALADESAKKVEAFTKSHQLRWDIRASKEYRELFQYYQGKIASHFPPEEEELAETEEDPVYGRESEEIDRRGLRNYDTVKRDGDYELFYLAREDGSRFYNKAFLRHLRLVANFDQILTVFMQDDPLVKIRGVQDQRAQAISSAIKNQLYREIDHWMAQVAPFNDDPLVQHLFYAVMALFLASNKRNLLLHTSGKSCLSYYEDFQNYLRTALHNVDYQKFTQEDPSTLEPFYLELLQLLHALCHAHIFALPIEDYGFAFFTRLIEKEKEPQQERSKTSPIALCNEVLSDLDKLLTTMSQYPSGPLFKVLDVLQSPVSERLFDPLVQGDESRYLFDLKTEDGPISFYAMPTPTRQAVIHKAEIIEKFSGALRHCIKNKEPVLIFNLQDRTSWKESARSIVVEEYQRRSEFRPVLDVITLPYDTEFYFQTADYYEIDSAKDFKTIFFEQIKAEEECGFSFPRAFSRKKMHANVKKLLELVHKQFFGGKKQLSRKNRMDFIEIFYQFFMLECIQMEKPARVMYCAKDSVDLASIAPAVLYAFVKTCGKTPHWKQEEKEHFLAMLFLPALLIRERSVAPARLNRAMQMLMIVLGETEAFSGITLSFSA